MEPEYLLVALWSSDLKGVVLVFISSQKVPGISLQLMLAVKRVFSPSSSFPVCLLVLPCVPNILTYLPLNY